MKVSVLKRAVHASAAGIVAAATLILFGCSGSSDVVISRPGVYLVELNGKGKVVLVAEDAEPAIEAGRVEILPHGSGATLYEVRTPRCGTYRWVVAAGQSVNIEGSGVVKDPACPIDTITLDNSQFQAIHGDPDRVVIKR